MAEIPRVLNVLLLDADGKRIAVKYFDEATTTVASQMAYERAIFAKTSRTNARGEAEIALLDKHLVVGKTLLREKTLPVLRERRIVCHSTQHPKEPSSTSISVTGPLKGLKAERVTTAISAGGVPRGALRPSFSLPRFRHTTAQRAHIQTQSDSARRDSPHKCPTLLVPVEAQVPSRASRAACGSTEATRCDDATWTIAGA